MTTAILHSKKHVTPCPLPSKYSTETQSHPKCHHCTLQKHSFTLPLPTGLHRNTHCHAHLTLYSTETHIPMPSGTMPTSISKLYRNTFTCPLLSYILQKHMSPCPLPSLHSTESLIHMPAYINVLKRSTYSRVHCQKCTPQKHTLTGTMHTALYRITYSHAHCYPAL